MNITTKIEPHRPPTHPPFAAPRLSKTLALGLLLLCTMSACQDDKDAKASTVGPGASGFNVDSATLVQTVKVSKGEPFVLKGDYAGEFAAERIADVAFEVSGRVLTLNYDIGDHVKEGAVLAKINDTVHRQKVREASAAAKMAEASIGEGKISVQDLESNIKRKRPLLDRQLISEREIEDLEAQLSLARQKILVAQANLEQSKARLQSAREDLRNTEIRAPFDAQIAARLVDLGSYVGPTQPAFQLVSEDGLYLRINIPEQDAGHIAVDKDVSVRIGALGSVKFDAKIARVAPIIDPSTRMLRADIKLLPADDQQPLLERLRPGMYAQVQVALGERDDAVTIPRQTLAEERGGARYVWVVKDDRAQQQILTLGLQGRKRVEVLSGLQGGESIVLRGGEKLKEGDKVSVQNPDEPASPDLKTDAEELAPEAEQTEEQASEAKGTEL